MLGRKEAQFNLLDLLSNDKLKEFLDSLDWRLRTEKNGSYEIYNLNELDSKSLIVRRLIEEFEYIQFDDHVYKVNGKWLRHDSHSLKAKKLTKERWQILNR